MSLSSGDEVPHIRESRVYSQKKKCTLVPHEPAMIHFGHLAGRSLPARKVQSRDYVWLSLYVRQSMDHYPRDYDWQLRAICANGELTTELMTGSQPTGNSAGLFSGKFTVSR